MLQWQENYSHSYINSMGKGYTPEYVKKVKEKFNNDLQSSGKGNTDKVGSTPVNKDGKVQSSNKLVKLG
jgi:hypothetical protein